jgi:dipeptidyl aminopeptidase/acylaminoacyl peptidase
MLKIRLHMIAAALSVAGAALPLGAQKVDYHKGDLIRVSSNYMNSASVYPSWMDDSVRFWYTSNSKADRKVTYLVDPRSASRKILFDNARLAAALSIAADTILDPSKLPGFKVVDNGAAIEITGGGGGFFFFFGGGGDPSPWRKKFWRCELASYKCSTLDSTEYVLKAQLKNGPSWASRSPDKKWDVFWYKHQLYVRPAEVSDAEARQKMDSVKRASKDTAKKDTTKKDAKKVRTDSAELPKGAIQLTTDGQRQFEYGVYERGLKDTIPSLKPSRPNIQWAPDSKKFVVQRTDNRNVRIFPIYSSTSDQPTDKSYYYATASDSVIPTTEHNVIDVIQRTNVKIDAPRSPDINFSPTPTWGRTSDHLFILNSTRAYKAITIFRVDGTNGKTTKLTRDSSAHWMDYGLVFNTFRVANDEDIFWLSERDGFSHIYRYGTDGKLKNQVDAGAFMTRSVVNVDTVKKQLYLSISGKEPSNPYFNQLYRVNFDGTDMTLLTPEAGAHQWTFAPKGPYIIDSYSRVDLPPVVVLRSQTDGKVIMELGRSDVDYLRTVGWTPPEVIKVKARDGVTDIYGLMYKPSNFDPSKSYPIIDHIYPGPFMGSTDVSYGFEGTGEPRGLAELGFIVVEIDHLGSPWRSTSFTQNYVNNMIDNGIPDHVAAIRQLAAQYSWIDINRVGIYGHSGGGYASTDAMFTFPDFYKVAVSGAGNHNPNTYGHFWAERYMGLYDKAKYEKSANFTYAKSLKGKLLLMHGDMDDNVHPANTLKVVDALIKANKNFDMIIFPDAGHGLPSYEVRKRWDYFVRYLMGGTPPEEYEMMKGPYGF